LLQAEKTAAARVKLEAEFTKLNIKLEELVKEKEEMEADAMVVLQVCENLSRNR